MKKYDLSATSQRNSWGNHYSHFNTMDVYMERGGEYADRDSFIRGRDLWDHIRDTVTMVSKKLESRGYAMIEQNQREEYIIDCAMINDMEFREDGRLWAG